MSDTTFDKQRERRRLDDAWRQYRRDKMTAEQAQEKRVLDTAMRAWESARMTDAERERISAALKGKA